MADSRLAPTNPTEYRFAVHCCGYKLDLTDKPDRAAGLFEHRAIAQQFGRLMWPNTFEIIDIITGEKV